MKPHFYIHSDGNREGPNDLLTMMRRIKNGKVSAGTMVSTDTMDVPMPASRLQDLAMFFDSGEKDDKSGAGERSRRSFSQFFDVGWRFISGNQNMSVFGGAIVLLTFLLGLPLYDIGGIGVAIMISSLVFFILQSIYMISALRLNRGQHINADFIQSAILANSVPLVLGSCILGVLFWVGVAFLIVPGVIMLSVYAFMPFLISDRGFSVIEAMEASRMLIARDKSAYFPTMIGLVGLHLLSCATVVLIPLTLPILAGALSELYDELSHKRGN